MSRPTTYKPKIKNKLCICKDCGHEFFAADPKSKRCDACSRSAAFCKCGQHKTKDSQYCLACRSGEHSYFRGKTYEEILGVDRAKLLRDQKIFSFKTSSKSSGEYRSLYEQNFADFLIQNKILFEYEIKLQGVEKTWSKLVDFFLPQQQLYIELSGYIWASKRELAQEKFLNRLLEVASFLPTYQFIIATEPKLLPRVQEYFDGYYPYNGKPVLILSLYELRQHILSLRK